MIDPQQWLAEAVVTRDLDRIKADMSAAGFRINDARGNVGGARQVKDTTPTLAISACHDAARKAITAHMIANGYRPKKGDGSHRIVVDYARIVLAGLLPDDDILALDDLRTDRGEAEYGDFAQRRFTTSHIEAAIELAERIVNIVASALAGRSKR